MLADLHVHTWFSDSTRSPEEVAREAKARGIGLIAVCDHNTVAGHAATAKACAEAGVGFLPGVEIDAGYGAGFQHILAYGCGFAHPPLVALLDDVRRAMEQVSIDLIERMRADDPRLDPAEYAAYERDPARGGWKGIDYLRHKGYEVAYPVCMEYYTRYGCQTGGFRPVGEVIATIHGAGGLAILAHPGKRLPTDTLDAHLLRLVEQGIDGIECYYPAHDPAFTRACLDFCNAHGLCITAGGDDHGSFAEWNGSTHYGLGEVQVDIGALKLGKLL